MTRLEVSILDAAIRKYDITKPSFKTLWHHHMIKAMKGLTDNFLNDEDNLERYYRQVHIPKLLCFLMRTPVNILAIGKKECWLIHAPTPHNRHFVGAHCSHSLYERPTEIQKWERLQEFVAKYASAGATIRVYWLYNKRETHVPTAEFKKDRRAWASLPGCTQPFLNNLYLPPFIQGPCSAAEASYFRMTGWVEAVRRIAVAIRDTKDEEIFGVCMKPAACNARN